MSITGPAGWCEDATTVARLVRGEVDAADVSPPPFFAPHDWCKLCPPKEHNKLTILLTASAFRLPTLAGALLALLLLAALGGCGGRGGAEPEPLPCHGYGCAYDVQGPAGMRLRYAPVVESSDPRANVVFLEQLYQMVEGCAGIQAPAPLVVIEKDGALVSPLDGLPRKGLYYADPDLVLIDDSAWTYWSLKHETVHYLLHHALGNSDPDHTSSLFVTCVELPFAMP